MSSICVFKFSALMLNTTLYEKTYNFFKKIFSVFWTPFTHKKIFFALLGQKQDCLLQGQAQLDQRVVFCFPP